jgi:outer membrane PBP1 activator LpoA protein
MSVARWIVRLATAAAATLALTACPSLGPRSEPPPSVDRAEDLKQQGDPAGAAHVYEQLANQNTGSERNEFAMQATRAWLAARRPEEAARALGMMQLPAMTGAQAFERQMLDVEILLARGQATQAVQQISAIPEPKGGPEAARYQALKQQALLAAARAPAGPEVPSGQAAPHIALLLPITGRTASAAVSVRDGFMAAFYQTPPAQRPQIRVYDTGETGVGEILNRANQDGAQFIVGPLTREEVTAAAAFPGRRPPILALNFLPPDRPTPAAFFQFALSPEDEAREAARRILADGHRLGIAFVPAGDWGNRVLAAFSQELQAGGGTLLSSASIDSGLTDFAEPITEALRITDSQGRHRRLESVLGTKLQFEPRRRGDLEFIFAAAPASTERLLRPQLRFHFAGDVPTYATSDAFEPDPRANQDLEALMFPDMPWMLGGELADAAREAARSAWPNGGPRRGRLFAFGFDAYRLALALRDHGNAPGLTLDGVTGRLSLDADRRVRRELGWAQLKGGEIRMLPPPANAAAN